MFSTQQDKIYKAWHLIQKKQENSTHNDKEKQ